MPTTRTTGPPGVAPALLLATRFVPAGEPATRLPDGARRLELETRTELSRKPTWFWANARLVLPDGSERLLAALDAPVAHPARTGTLPKRAGSETGARSRVTFENIEQPESPGKDYFGGPLKIAGQRTGASK